MVQALRRALDRLRPTAQPRSEGEVVRDREENAKWGLVDGHPLTPDGGVIDFESDSERPRPSS